jgi:hypothetical protein
MIYTDRLLYVHAPKTAGMALSDALLRALIGQVYYVAPEGQHGREQYGQINVVGQRHATLRHAVKYFEAAQPPKGIDEFDCILTVIRNPYDVEVSRYHYLQKGSRPDRGGEAQSLAMSGDFDLFAKESEWFYPYADYYHIDGWIPDNVTIVRYEELADSLPPVLAPYLDAPLDMKVKNQAKRDRPVASYINRDNEEYIYRKYQWMFDKGYYSRMLATS